MTAVAKRTISMILMVINV